ncbi:hypothetical protein D1BOALGB6SA_4869 [Olavius sp. associated proteobacterium Delta 1]|nr:hypothetical protein D1BOALGB6SA_4869 [Olavius sp. associated proteobacterium Delta 1]
MPLQGTAENARPLSSPVILMRGIPKLTTTSYQRSFHGA